MNKLLHLLSNYKKQVISLVLLSLISAILESLGIAILAPVLSVIFNSDVANRPYIPSIFPTGGKELISLITLFVPILFIVKNSILICSKYLSNKAVFLIKANLETRLFQNYLKLDYETISKSVITDFSSKIMTEVQIFTFNVMQALIVMITEMFFVTFVLIGFLVYDAALFITMVIPLLLFTFPIYRYSTKRQKKWGEENRRSTQGLFAILEIGIGAFKEIRIYDSYKYFLKRFESDANTVGNSFASSQTLAMMSLPILETIIISTIFGSIYYLFSIKGVSASDIAAMVGLFGLVSMRLLPGMSRLFTSVNQIKFGLRAVYSIYDDLQINTIAKRVISPQLRQSTGDFKSLVFKNVDFSYRGCVAETSVLEKINFEIRTAQRIGICGESGAGKSTLVGLVLGLLSPTSGQILLNGLTSAEYEVTEYWSMIGYVPQDVYIADASIVDNVAFGVEPDEIDIDLVGSLCETLGLFSILAEGETYLSTKLASRGTSISGGQRARIGLARALYRKPKVLILDEVTSGLDENTAEFILKNYILENKSELTVILISHRITHFAGFDEIWTVKNCGIQKEIMYYAEP